MRDARNHLHDEEGVTVYLDLAARGKTQWWRYFLTPLLAVGLAMAGLTAISVALTLAHLPMREIAGELVQPSNSVVFFSGVTVLYGGLAAAFALGIWLVHGKHPGDIAGRLNLALFLKGAVVWAAVQLALAGIDYLIAPDGFSITFAPATVMLALVAAIGLSVQTFAEEFVFRGWLTQALLLATRRPLMAAIVSGVLFGALHIPNGMPQFASACVFGVTSSLIAIRTGSIAFTYGLHLVNNYLGAVVLVSAGDVFHGSPGIVLQNTPALAWWDVALNAVALILVVTSMRIWRSRAGDGGRAAPDTYPNGVVGGPALNQIGKLQRNGASPNLGFAQRVTEKGKGMRSFPVSCTRRFLVWGRDRSGNIAAITALLIVPLVGCLSLATEGASWFLTQRAAQAAADAAVLAAAANGDASTYAAEASAVATNAGFTNGTNYTTVAAANNVACPSGSGSTCYSVTITRTLPLYLTQIVGYSGTSGQGGRQLIEAVAYASAPTNTDDCMVTLSSTGGFTLKGGPGFSAAGCDLYSNGTAACSGHNGGFELSTTVGTTNTCGLAQKTGASPQPETYYANLYSGNPLLNCVTVTSPATSGQTLNPTKATCITISGSFTVPAGGTTTINTATQGTVFVIKSGGNLNLNGTLTTPSVGNGLTIIFSANGKGNSPGFISSGSTGTLEYSAPTSGTWSGVAMYQDPSNQKASTQTYSGGSPTFDITGVVYAPYTDLTFTGNINHDIRTGGNACLIVIANTMGVNGNGSIFSNPTSQCVAAGVGNVPQALVSRQALVE